MRSQVLTARIAAIARHATTRVPRFDAGTCGSRRVWLFTLVLTWLTVALGMIFVPAEPPLAVPVMIPPWLLAACFYLAEAKVIHLHIGRSAHRSREPLERPQGGDEELVRFPAESAATQNSAVTQETDEKFHTSGSIRTGSVQVAPSNIVTDPA